MYREECETGQDQSLFNIPFIDDDNVEDNEDGKDDINEKARRKEGTTTPHDKLSTIQHSK